MATKPHIVFVLGSEAWLSWLPPFLGHPEYEYDVCCDPAELARLLSPTRSAVVFLSHHRTLHRDAELSCHLAAKYDIRVFAHPRGVADLALDKRVMAHSVSGGGFVSAIPELSPEEAADGLRTGQRPVVVAKLRAGTEGTDFRILRDPVGVEDIARSPRADEFLFQPFVAGEEVSVNLVSIGGSVVTFEPVWKGRNGLDEPHPSRRLRRCPSSPPDPVVATRAIECGQELARRLDLRGLLEVELIWDGQLFHLLEFNPRLSATMRMTSVACGRSLFTELGLAAAGFAWRDEVVRAIRFTAEIPCPDTLNPDQRLWLETQEEIWVTTRVTMAAASCEALDARLRGARARLADGVPVAGS